MCMYVCGVEGAGVLGGDDPRVTYNSDVRLFLRKEIVARQCCVFVSNNGNPC